MSVDASGRLLTRPQGVLNIRHIGIACRLDRLPRGNALLSIDYIISKQRPGWKNIVQKMETACGTWPELKSFKCYDLSRYMQVTLQGDCLSLSAFSTQFPLIQYDDLAILMPEL